jgi:hypothetical protein
VAGRPSTAKQRARRIDRGYFKHQAPLRRWRFLLSLGAVTLAAIWMLSYTARGSYHAYSPGVVSEPHAMFGEKCDLCHLPEGQHAATRKWVVVNKACVGCHDGPRHTKDTPVGTCTDCHTEHRGRHIQITAVSDTPCAGCHAKEKPPITGFLTDHPDFPELKQPDPGTVNLNHKVHMAQGLTCDACHGRVSVPCKPKGADCARATTTFAFMVPVTYADTCASCHDDTSLKTSFGDDAPHADPQKVDDWFQKNHHGDALKMTIAEQQLWQSGCGECHAGIDAAPGKLPTIEPAATPARWFPKAAFSHDAHRSIDCLDCHATIPNSTKTSDVNLPDLKTCQGCHGPKHAESRCFECHSYHEWKAEKSTPGKFKLNQVAMEPPRWLVPEGHITPAARR